MFIITVAVFVFFIVHVEKNIDTFPIESEILIDRMLYSNNGLWLYDQDIGRLYPGILELETFKNKPKIESSLNKTMYYGKENKRAAAELVLEDKDKNKFGPIYYNEQKYKEWVEWYKAGVIEGAGGRKGKTKEISVMIKDKDGSVPGTLSITVLIPNR